MAYGRKYYTTYKRRSGDVTTIDILEDGYSGASTELKPNVNPLIISQNGDVNNIYTPTIGSGAQINLLVSPLTLSTLYTTDPQKYMVKVYNGASGGTLIWQGFVDASIYQEDYSIGGTLLVPVSLNCSDGMALLEKIWYKNSGTAYTGLTTIGNVINTVIGKLGLTFTNVYTSNDIAYINSAAFNLWNNLKVNNDNFIDESDVAMSCREVLESVIGGLGLVMFFRAADIYIIDPINLHTTSKGRKFVLPDFTESSESLGGYIDISGSTLSYYETSQVLDVTPPVNEVEINYDPYNYSSLSFDFNDSETWDAAGSFTNEGDYYLNTTVDYTDWTEGTAGQFCGVKEGETDDPTYGLYLNNDKTSIVWNTGKNLYPDSDLSLKISLESFCNTKETTPNIFSDGDSATFLYQNYIQFKIKCGDQWCKGDLWDNDELSSTLQISCRDWSISTAQYVSDNTLSRIEDVWADGYQTIPLYNGLSGGTVVFTIIDSWDTDTVNPTTADYYLKSFFIKNIKIEIIETVSGKVVENLGTMFRGNYSGDVVYKHEPIKLNTTNGTGTYGVSRGAYFDTTNLNYDGLFRSGNATRRNTAYLILQSYISQYKQPRYKLSAALDVSEYLLSFNLYLFCDNTYLPGKAFYVYSSKYDDRDEKMDVEMVEITNTREDL